jgi:outer membrane protein assembly factor BamB
VRTATAVAFAAAGSLLLAACGASQAQVTKADAWQGAHGGVGNSASSAVTGRRSPTATWWRSVGGTVVGGLTVAVDGQLFVAATRPDSGCNLFSFQPDGRKRFCDSVPFTDPTPRPIPAAPIVDPDDNAYVGIGDGTMRSYNAMGQERWVMPTFGTPIGAQFIGDGDLLEATQFGEIDVFTRQTGKRETDAYRLFGEPNRLVQPDLPYPPSDQGLGDCATGSAGCPVATAPAVDPSGSGRFYLTAWFPHAAGASLAALRYADGKISREWTASDLLTSGTTTPPSLSLDGKTVYVGDNAGDLYALDAASGAVRWTYHLGFVPAGAIALTADGLIIPGTRDGSLLGLRDEGDRPVVAWHRDDVSQAGVPAVARGDLGYTEVAVHDGLTLLVFDTATGRDLTRAPLPDAHAPAVDTAVGPKAQVLTVTQSGELVQLGSGG